MKKSKMKIWTAIAVGLAKGVYEKESGNGVVSKTKDSDWFVSSNAAKYYLRINSDEKYELTAKSIRKEFVIAEYGINTNEFVLVNEIVTAIELYDDYIRNTEES